MATDTASQKRQSIPEPDGVEWENLPGGGLGDEWDFERDGTLIGHFIGTQDVETQKVESGHATAVQFAPINEPDALVFVWASSELSQFTATDEHDMPLVAVGSLVKIQYLGRDNFTGADGKPRQIKRYRVQSAKRG